MTARREPNDAVVIKWEFDQDVWGVALTFPTATSTITASAITTKRWQKRSGC